MSLIRYIQFPLGIHLLQGLAIPPDLLFILLCVLIMYHTHPSPRPHIPSRPPFRPQSHHSGPQKSIRRYDGPIFLPPQICKLLSQDTMKALKASNSKAVNRFHQRKVHNTEIVETPQDDLPEPPVPENDHLTFLKVP